MGCTATYEDDNATYAVCGFDSSDSGESGIEPIPECTAGIIGSAYFDVEARKPCFCNGRHWMFFDGTGICFQETPEE